MNSVADYQLLEELSEGNHGTFHVARTPSRLGIDDPLVTVKVLHLTATDAAFAGFARELRAIVAAGSPYLTTLLDAGQAGGRLFYAVPHYASGSLASGGHDVDVIVRAVADAARGAHDLHELGVVHRDIRPSNVMVTDDGGGHLADLGLATAGSLGTMTVGVGPIGTVEYMEPEVVMGERAGRASDIWSLAITAHEALTGVTCHPTLPRDSAIAAFRHVVHEPPALHPDLDPALAAVIARALAPSRADRHPTALDFALDLERAGGRTS